MTSLTSLTLLLVCCLSHQTEWTFRCKNGEDFIYFYAGCSYNVQLWGANSGKGFQDGKSANGGVGAYVNGTIRLGTGHNMRIRVGEAGSDGFSKWGGAGGYNGGAKGGDDTGDGDDAAGGGGGATDIGFSNGTRIAAAGAGSGAACGVFGAPGAGIGEHGDLESGPTIVFVKSGGTGTSSGQAGRNTGYCPGSGGGGGWEGGLGNELAWTNPYTAIAQSGSSGYLSEYMTSVSVKRGNDPDLPSKPDNNGYAIVRLINSNDITCQYNEIFASEKFTSLLMTTRKFGIATVVAILARGKLKSSPKK